MKIPDDYRPVSFETMLKHFATKAPELGPMLFEHLHPHSESPLEGAFNAGFITTRIEALEQKGLIQFSISRKGEPGMFAKARAEGDFTEEESALADKLISFWDVTGDFDSKRAQIITAAINPGGPILIHTPDGTLSVAASVAARLYKLGMLTEEKGELHAPSRAQVLVWIEEKGVCDFCSDEHPTEVVMVPDFEMSNISQVPRSEGGWKACQTCYDLVASNNRTDLLKRAIAHSLGGRWSSAAIQGLHKRFWNAYDAKIAAAGIGAGLMDFIEDRIEPDTDWINPKLKQRTARVEAVRRLTGLTVDEVQALGQGDVLHKDVVAKLTAWHRRFGVGTSAGNRKIAEMLNAAEERAKIPMHLQPHWQQALDRKVEAIERLSKIEMKVSFDGNLKLMDSPRNRFLSDVNDDLQALKRAEVYSFNADTMHAIQIAAAKIPHEAPLKSIEVPPFRAGWFWFSEPMPVASAPVSSSCTHALLWTWATQFKEPTLRFSCYVVEEKAVFGDVLRGTILPSTMWFWPLSATFHEMIGINHGLYDEGYGPGSPDRLEKELAIGKEATLAVVAEMSLFFMKACQWFRDYAPGNPKKKKDPILTQTAGHIERHARKRYEKAFKITPTVRVIALRKSAPTVREESMETADPNDKTKRFLKVRFVVDGHDRLQRCGPGLTETKLIHIEEYPKGPEDAPWKEKGPRVFAVIR